MYDELVKALRGCVLSKPCDGCPYYDPEGPTEKCATMNIAAADAIEELQQAAEHYHGCMNEWFEAAQEYKAAVPKWIPVGERLPELHGEEFSNASGETVRYQCSDPVLIWLGGGGDFIAIGTYEVDDHLEGWMMGGSVISCVTHWMQIPPPPEAKEGE